MVYRLGAVTCLGKMRRENQEMCALVILSGLGDKNRENGIYK